MLFESEADETILVATLVSVTNPDKELVDRVDPEHLSSVRATIWQAARDLRVAGKSITPRNIAGLHPGNQSVIACMQAIAGRSWSAARIAEAERTVTELGDMRRLQGALTAAQERLEVAETYSEALEAAHAELGKLSESQAGPGVRLFADVWEQWQQTISSRERVHNAIPTPWPDLNKKLAGGLHRGRTYVAGGRPGEGKSILGVNMATDAAEAGYSTVIFSVEMREHEVASRIIASGAHAEYGQITRREIDDFNWSRIGEWGDTNSAMPLRIVDKSNIGVEYVTAVCRTIKRAHGLDVVFVDYLQLLNSGGGASKATRERQIAEMSRALKVLAQEQDCAVIIACQLNRNSANEKRAPILADLRESGAIEQDCDVAILLHHILDGGERTGDVELVVAKNRTGTLGAVRARWMAYQARIS